MMPAECHKAGCHQLGLVLVRLHIAGADFEEYACFDHADAFSAWCAQQLPSWQQQWGPALLSVVEIP